MLVGGRWRRVVSGRTRGGMPPHLLSLSLSCLLSLSHTQTDTHTRLLFLSLSHTLAFSISLSHKHTHTLSLSLSLSHGRWTMATSCRWTSTRGFIYSSTLLSNAASSPRWRKYILTHAHSLIRYIHIYIFIYIYICIYTYR